MGLLSLAIWTPIAFGIVLLALGRDEQAGTVRWVALVGAIVSFLVTLPLYSGLITGISSPSSLIGFSFLDLAFALGFLNFPAPVVAGAVVGSVGATCCATGWATCCVS